MPGSNTHNLKADMPHITANNIKLYYEDTGPADAPVILLVMGLGTQMIAWPEPFIQALVARGFRVIHYDNRDIGLSQYMDGAAAPNLVWAMFASRFGLPLRLAYSLEDMAADGAALLGALGIQKAHVVGASMGGMIAQLMAANHPERVASMTSIMSSSGRPGLPGPSPQMRKQMLAKRPSNPTREQAIALSVAGLKMMSYPDPTRAPDAFEQIAGRSYDRGYNPEGVKRQFLAIIADGSRVSRLKKITAPTLVIHGRADPLVPLACGEDTARLIAGARLEVIDEMAHDLPPSQLEHLVGLIADHAS
jgi:pimeloyl-ACP methyl ester carboxylesterase